MLLQGKCNSSFKESSLFGVSFSEKAEFNSAVLRSKVLISICFDSFSL